MCTTHTHTSMASGLFWRTELSSSQSARHHAAVHGDRKRPVAACAWPPLTKRGWMADLPEMRPVNIKDFYGFNMIIADLNLHLSNIEKFCAQCAYWICFTNILFKSVHGKYMFYFCIHTRGKSRLELWFPDWQPSFIFVWFISNFLCMCSNSMASALVIFK